MHSLKTPTVKFWILGIFVRREKTASCFFLLPPCASSFLSKALYCCLSSLIVLGLELPSDTSQTVWVPRIFQVYNFFFLASAKADGSRRWTRATGKSQAGRLPRMRSSLERGASGFVRVRERPGRALPRAHPARRECAFTRNEPARVEVMRPARNKQSRQMACWHSITAPAALGSCAKPLNPLTCQWAFAKRGWKGSYRVIMCCECKKVAVASVVWGILNLYCPYMSASSGSAQNWGKDI